MSEALECQLLVIGGGSTGAGVAWDAALRGFQVILADRGDLATGTTGRFHGLLHSGGRYAVRDPGGARECARENVILRRVATAAHFFRVCEDFLNHNEPLALEPDAKPGDKYP